jgi:hypothetical protein
MFMAQHLSVGELGRVMARFGPYSYGDFRLLAPKAVEKCSM